METKESIYEKYEIITNNIDNSISDKQLKEKLEKINNQIFNLVKNKMASNIKVIIENWSQDLINISLDIIVDIFENYELIKNEAKIYDDELKINKNDLIIINDFELFERNKISYSYRIEEFEEKLLNNNCSIIITSEDYIENHYTSSFNEKFLKGNIELKIQGEDYDNNTILKKLKSLYKENKIKCNIPNKTLNTIITASLKNDECYLSNCANYLYDYSIKQKILNDIEYIDETCFKEIKEDPKEMANNKTRLRDLTGLKSVKEEIKKLENFLKFRKKLEKDIDNIYLNMMFLGNPGTGKTTVAREYAKILYKLGYIKENKLVEIIPTDLMANYVGQTKDKTREILRKASGGILFIDEAYLIANTTFRSGQASFMKEAVVEIIKYMENPENIIIFAGYPLETRKIYETNPGIKSRICKEIYFPDYTEEELLRIIKKDLNFLGLKTTKETDKTIKNIIKAEKRKTNFGNARFAKTYIQEIIMNHANLKLKKETYTITKSDVLRQEEETFQMGFRR